MSSANDVCHFWRPPLELCDNIYDLLVAKEERLALEIDLCATKTREPQVMACTASGISRASSEPNREYSVALSRRVKTILHTQAPAEDVDDPNNPSNPNFASNPPFPDKTETIKGDWLAKDPQWMRQLDAKSRIHVSQDWRPRRGTLIQRTHAYTVPILYRMKETISVGSHWVAAIMNLARVP